MNTVPVLFSIFKADYQERSRRASFRLTLCLAIYLGYAVSTGQILIKLGIYRGVYNSAWVGSMMALVITFFLGLVGFFLVKNTIERDERSGVGQILATTSLTRPQYLLGKWLSNLTILGTLVGILAAAAILMQMIYREVPQIQIWPLIAPFLFIALPMMALVSAFAVFFEASRWLKGGFGNLVYFFLFSALLLAGIFLPQFRWIDIVGLSLVGSHMRAAAAALPGYDGTFTLAFISGKPLQTFAWPGLDWTAGLITERLLWIAVSLGVVLFATLFFHRFDPYRRAHSKRNNASPTPEKVSAQEEEHPVSHNLPTTRLSPLSSGSRFHFNIARLVWLECLLLVKGLKWYWLAGLAILWIACAAAPSETIRKLGFMLAAVWPVLIWSQMGEREVRCQAEQLIYQAAYPLSRLFICNWLAGVFITAMAVSGALLGRLIYVQPLMLLHWGLSVVFIPTLALCLGAWSRSSKAFEVVYPILWYLGPFNPQNGLVILDYLGIHAQAPIYTAPFAMLGAVSLLLLLAWVGRRQQIRM